jgi:hypothetical protein
MTDVAKDGGPIGVLGSAFKDKLAWWVFGLSTLGIMTVASIYAYKGNDNSSREIFSTLVPLFGTWVGTILAFYFSRENFREANEAVNRAFQQLTPDQQLQQTSVKQVMKVRGAIRGLEISEGKSEADILVGDMQALISKGYGRVPIFGKGDVILYIVHESLLNKFIAESAVAKPGFTLADATLSDFLAHSTGSETLKAWASRKAFVKVSATLADARDAMLAAKGSQDVFITQNGKAEEPVQGWLTNTDITRDL